MEKVGDDKHVIADWRGERRSKEDRLSNLPESLVCKILSNLSSKNMVKTSALSTGWRYLWRYVPTLNVEHTEFQDFFAFARFVDRFLHLSGESCLESVRICYDTDDEWADLDCFKRWINNVVRRKVKHFEVSEEGWDFKLEIPPSVYTCETLVTLKLYYVMLSNPKSIFLPLVKFIDLTKVLFANELVLKKLISNCPVLESLDIHRSSIDDVNFLRVCSRSLLRLKHTEDCTNEGHNQYEVAIDAPRLKYLSLFDHKTARYSLKSSDYLVEAGINMKFDIQNPLEPDDLPKRYMIRDFLVGISRVKRLSISSYTLQIIYDTWKWDLPVFHNLSSLRTDFEKHTNIENHNLEMLPAFLKSCPNLNSLVVNFWDAQEEEN